MMQWLKSHRAPTLEQVGSQACTASQFHEAAYEFWCREIAQKKKFHRKQWEYVFTLQALRLHARLREGVRCLGFGCGKEPLAAVMAKYGCEVLVTDIPPPDSSDVHWGSREAADLFYPGICLEEVFRQRVNFRQVDMRSIPKDLGNYDVVWSCCALEHLGSLEAGMHFVVESSRCLKQGGIAIHTTEFNVTNNQKTLESPGLSLYRKKDILELERRLRRIGARMHRLNWVLGDLPQDQHVDLPPYPQETHLKLLIDAFVTTSFGFIISAE